MFFVINIEFELNIRFGKYFWLEKSRLGGFWQSIKRRQTESGSDSETGFPTQAVDFVAEDVYAHGRQSQAKDEVNDAQHHVDRMLRNEVAQTDGWHGHENEIEWLEKCPFFEYRENKGSEEAIAQEDRERCCDG